MGRVLGILALASVMGGCRGGVVSPFEGRRAEPGVAFPFAPASMRIHPLSRIVPDAIICHLEFRDAWGDTAKAAGVLVVELVGDEATRWDIDLSDLDSNGRLYDPATRTYRIRLREAPVWVAPGSPVRLRASWRGHDAEGAEIPLSDEVEVR